MTFDSAAIFVLGTAALLYAAFVRGRGRGWALLIGSVVAIYWLQPNLPIRFSAYILQTTTVVLTVMTWWLTRQRDNEGKQESLAAPGRSPDRAGAVRRPAGSDRFLSSPKQQETWREDKITLLVIALLVVGMAFNRYLGAEVRIIARPPSPLLVMIALLVVTGLFGLIALVARQVDQRRVMTVGIIVVVIIFVLMKLEPAATAVATLWRTLTAQDRTMAAMIDLNWLGFSYVAFRLIHTMRDRQTGILPALSLREFVTYVIFAPSYIAGPIDRAERFVQDFRALPAIRGLDASRFVDGGTRIIVGMFKKFVVADLLAQGMSLNPINATQATSTWGLWLLLYGYAFRLFFDFSGYTDIAIGLGILFGIRLPENFKRPYLKSNITTFWQSWHITLSNWVRFYVFSPLSRSLLRRKPRPSLVLIVFISQMTTMIIIGLWHGISWNFFIWGVWHGLALFVHKQWSDRTRKWYRNLKKEPRRLRAWTLFSWFLTFQYVVIGWVWFAIPSVKLGAQTIVKLFGLGW